MAKERVPRLEEGAAEPLVLDQFAGMVTNRGVLFGPPTAAEWQENLRISGEGKLEGRNGLKIVSWEN